MNGAILIRELEKDEEVLEVINTLVTYIKSPHTGVSPY